MKKIRHWKKAIKTTPFIMALLWALISTSLVVAVTYFHDTQTTTQSFSEGGTATFKNVALPVAFLQTPDSYIEDKALNISTYVDSTQMVFTQTSSQRTNLQGTYNTLSLTIKDDTTGTVAVTWDLLLDLSVSITLPIAGSYSYDYEYSYESKVSSGTIAIDWDLDLIS